MTGMDGHQNRFNCSSPMRDIDQPYPLPQEIESQKWNNALESSQRALSQSMSSPAYRRLLDSTASLWDQDPQGLQDSSNGTIRGGGGESATQLPSSDATVKMGNSYKGRHDGYAKPSVANTAGISPGGKSAQGSRNARSETLRSLRSHAHTEMSTEPPCQPYLGGPDHTNTKPAMRRTSSGWLHEQAERSQGPLHFGTNPNAPIFQAGHRPSTLSTPFVSPNDLHMSRQIESHERKRSDRVSSLPSIPSPLGPGRMRQQVHETGGSVPLSSVPNGSIQRAHEMAWRRPWENGTHMEELKQRNRGLSSPTVQRYASTGSVSPAFDITPRSAQIDDEGNIFINSSKHSRKHTDPFVDHEPVQYSSRPNRPAMSGHSTHFQLPPQPSMRLLPTPVSVAWPTSAPTNFRSARQPTPASAPPTSATFHRATPLTPAFLTSASGPVPQGHPPTPSDQPIPPPPLSSIQGKYHHTPEARARLEAQKSVREEWIRTEATKIGHLARLKQDTYHCWVETNTELAYKNWQKAEAALFDATNTEKKKEERRNLFLNDKGMTALKTDQAEDMSADSRDDEARGGEEKLLGYQMATMERVCAEVKRDEGDEIITAEMLATLSLKEKKALRKHLLGRLKRS